MVKASIVIRSKDEEKFLGRTLEKVFEQTYKDFEVILVDSGSTDKTLSIASSHDVDIEKMPPEEFTFGRALNIGAKKSKGEFIVYLTAHAIPVDKNWLQNLLNGFINENVAAVYGGQIPRKDCDPIERKDTLDAYGTESRIQTKNPFFSNSNSAIKNNVWAKNQFNEDIEISEDYEWANRILSQGYQIRYQADAIVTHSHNYPLRQVYHRFYREGMAHQQISGYRLSFIRMVAEAAFKILTDLPFLIKKGQILTLPHSMGYRIAQRWGKYEGAKAAANSKDDV
ncbi:glycosyltransferase [Candidatus Altiarchaeota archaeon]